MLRDGVRDLSPVASIAAAAGTATANGAAVDLHGYGSAAVLVTYGTVTDGTHTAKIQESDDGSTGWADVAAADMTGAFTAATSGAGNGSNTVQRRSYIGNKRFIRPVVTVSGATTGAVRAAMVLRGKSALAPQA